MTARKVYFNGACPVCKAGVAKQRRKMQGELPHCTVEWLDINDDRHALADRGVSLDDVRLKLYVEDEEGKLQVGAAAFATLWRDTPSQRWLGRLVSRPGFSTLARGLYDLFAVVLYRWNRYKGRW